MIVILSERFLHSVVILSKRFLRSEGSRRAARGVAFFATHYWRVWLASLSPRLELPDTFLCQR